MSHRPGAFHLGGLVTTTTAFSAAKRVTKKFPGIVNTVSNTLDAYQKNRLVGKSDFPYLSAVRSRPKKNEINAILLRGVFFSGGTEVGRSPSSLARQESGPLLPFFSSLLLFTSLSIISRRGHPMSGGVFWNQITRFPGSLPS